MARLPCLDRRSASRSPGSAPDRCGPSCSDSGLQFRVVTEGKGEPIATADAALLDYVGTLDDGTVFDSSESHGGAQPFTASQVFPGFAEAMGRMREGGEYRFTMPPNLAWGEGPDPAGLPGRAAA